MELYAATHEAASELLRCQRGLTKSQQPFLTALFVLPHQLR